MHNRKKHHPLKQTWKLKKEQSPLTIQKRIIGKKHLEAMTANLWNNLRTHFKLNVLCAAYFFGTHIKLHVAALASATCVVSESKLERIAVQLAEKTTLKSFQTRASSVLSPNSLFFVHTETMGAAHGWESWESYRTT